MVLKNKLYALLRDYAASKLRKTNALAQLYKDYIEYLKGETQDKIDKAVLLEKEKLYRAYQIAYYDIGEETKIFETVFNHKYAELKKKQRMKFRAYRESVRRKIAKLDPEKDAEEIETLRSSIENKEREINEYVETIANGWREEFKAESALRASANPSDTALMELKQNIEANIDAYRKEAIEKYTAKHDAKVAKIREKIAKIEATIPGKIEKLETASKKYAKLEAETIKNETEKKVSKLNTEISKYEELLTNANEQEKEKYEKILTVLRSDLSLLETSGKTKEEIIKDDEVLAIDNLCMYFGGIKAVNKLSFSVKHKEIFGLIGPNGAGKTTVFNCITQFYKPTAGNISFRNKNNEIVDLTKEVVHNVILQGIVRTFQNLEVIKDITVLDNLLIAAHRDYTSGLFQHMLHTPILRVEENVITQRALKVLEFMGLLKYKDMYAWGLPYGILKKIEIARTLMCNPQLIILDEPAAGLNDSETVELAELIRRIRDEYNTTVLLVEHDMGLVMDVCDRICAISFGNLLALGTPKEIQSNKAVQEAYLGVSED